MSTKVPFLTSIGATWKSISAPSPCDSIALAFAASKALASSSSVSLGVCSNARATSSAACLLAARPRPTESDRPTEPSISCSVVFNAVGIDSSIEIATTASSTEPVLLTTAVPSELTKTTASCSACSVFSVIIRDSSRLRPTLAIAAFPRAGTVLRIVGATTVKSIKSKKL